MRFYTKQHTYDCGIDLHARSMYVCVLEQEGTILLHRKMKTAPEALLIAIAAYRADLVVAVECIFTWDLAGRSVRPRGFPVRLGACAVHEGYPRWQDQERADRLAEDCGAPAGRHAPHGLRLPPGDARHVGPIATPHGPSGAVAPSSSPTSRTPTRNSISPSSARKSPTGRTARGSHKPSRTPMCKRRSPWISSRSTSPTSY
jgi:hypothetical protein